MITLMNPMTFAAPISPSVSSAAPPSLLCYLGLGSIPSLSQKCALLMGLCLEHWMRSPLGEACESLFGRSETWCLELFRGAFGALLLTFGNGEKTLELPMVTKTWNPNLRQEEPEFQASLGHGEKR